MPQGGGQNQALPSGPQGLVGAVPMTSSQAMLLQGGMQNQQRLPRVMSALTPQHPAGVPIVGIGGQLNPGQTQLGRATSGPQLEATQQMSLFNPQRTNIPSIGDYLGPTAATTIGMMNSPNAPVDMSIMGSPLGIGPSAVGSPILTNKMRDQLQQPRRRPPTV